MTTADPTNRSDMELESTSPAPTRINSCGLELVRASSELHDNLQARKKAVQVPLHGPDCVPAGQEEGRLHNPAQIV